MSTTKKSTEQVPFLERPIVRTILPIAGFVIICVLFAILTDGRLFQPKNISLLLSQSYMLLISSIGVFMVMTMGGLDFSQGSMLGVASIVVCYLSHYNMVLAALGGVVTGGLIGLINGYFNVKRKITSFIVTICTMYLFRGVCAYATTNSPVYAVSDISKYNTLPFMLTFTVIIFVVAYLVFTYTGLGSRLKAIGAGETAARFAGIRVETTKILVFVAAGCITGLAAFVNAIKVGSVTSTAGNQLETQIMIALVLGGMPVNGGAKVRFYNIILGVMTYKVLSSGLVMLMMPTQLQQLILGIIFLIEVAIFSFGAMTLIFLVNDKRVFTRRVAMFPPPTTTIFLSDKSINIGKYGLFFIYFLQSCHTLKENLLIQTVTQTKDQFIYYFSCCRIHCMDQILPVILFHRCFL